MKIQCPFYNSFGDQIKCVYMDEWHYCDELEVNPGNGDAWCYVMIEEQLRRTPDYDIDY